MRKELVMDEQALRAQIDICGLIVARVNHDAQWLKNDKLTYALNMAIASLDEAFRILSGEEEE